MFIVKTHKSEENRVVIAIIDKDILGKEFIEGNKILNLKSEFYNGEEKSEEETIKLIYGANHLNVVGKKIIALLKKEDLIDKTKEIGGCPYAQIILS